ncbi:hypothetical protein ElyMa_002442200 [Elysia marginata]|uniref:Vitellogenin domain-containing protein n=1 Tax=Elysia marginata TaxID=1093978 RepID=A0AAV4GIB7_9GAST|nr:hypothetical protein ElyMa_002442200 [Elysia marginata]
MDLRALLQSPSTKASAPYYRTKLSVHNMTYYNCGTKEAFCYTYDETQGDLSSYMFASLHHQHFSSYITKNPGIKRTVLWSDGCGYQKRCTAVPNAFLQLSSETGVSIEHKYLVPGHTQMECDSIHNTNEREETSGRHFLATVMKLSRQNSGPYEVNEITYKDARKLSPDFLKSIRPMRKIGDPKVTDVRAYKYFKSEDGVKMMYKLNWEDDSQKMPFRIVYEVKTWTPLYDQRLLISSRKFEDLQAMKAVMPQFAHEFYANLTQD